MIDFKWYEDRFREEFKDSPLNVLEYQLEQTILHGSNGRGQLASVPLIKVGILEGLIKQRKKGN